MSKCGKRAIQFSIAGIPDAFTRDSRRKQTLRCVSAHEHLQCTHFFIKMTMWKGKLVTEKQYNRRLKQVESGKSRKKEVEDEAECAVDGRRIVDLKVMSKHMRCSFCAQDYYYYETIK